MTDAVRAVRDAVPTSRHAQLLFSMVEDRLGESGYVERFNQGTELRLYERSGDDYVPWPLLSLSTRGRLSHVMMIRGPDEPPAPRGRKRRLRNLGPGELTVHEGPESITVTYGDDGRWFETSQSAGPLWGVAQATEQGTGGPTERLSEFIAGLVSGQRVLSMPVPLPGALRVLWARGRRAIRHALFHGRVPDDARWIAADGYDGVALGWGVTRDEALARWRGEVERLRPRPQSPKEPDRPPPPGAMRLQGPSPDGETPVPAPENTPAAVVQLEPPPDRPPGFGEWTRLLGDHGLIFPAARRQDVAGFTLVGDRLMEALGDDGLKQLDETLARVEPPDPGAFSDREYNCVTVVYELVDEQTGVPAPRVCETRRSDGFDPGMLDARQIRWRVVRQRWRDLE